MSAYVTVQLDIFSNQEAEHDQHLPVTALSVTVLIPKTEMGLAWFRASLKRKKEDSIVCAPECLILWLSITSQRCMPVARSLQTQA